MKLNNKVFIITGATSGMGRAIALKLAEEGASLILNGRDQKKGAAVEDEIESKTSKVKFLAGDVGVRPQRHQLARLGG